MHPLLAAALFVLAGLAIFLAVKFALTRGHRGAQPGQAAQPSGAAAAGAQPGPDLHLSDPLWAMVDLAFEHAFNSIAEGGPLIPFALTEASGQRAINRYYSEEDIAIGITEGRKAIAAARPDHAVLAYDGYLRVNGQRTDAILIDAHERGVGHRFAKLYQPAEGDRPLKVISPNVAYLEPCDPLF